MGNMKLINNNIDNKMIDEIKNNLDECKEFIFCISFITESGVQILKSKLLELQNQNIKGIIITGTYLNFTAPKALSELAKFSNIDLKIYNKRDFHAKGFIFQNNKNIKLIIGSSNLTKSALLNNKEWNLNVQIEYKSREYIDLFEEINNLFKESKDYLFCKEEYQKIYEENQRQRELFNEFLKLENKKENIQLNIVQKRILEKIEKTYQNKNKRGLLISATGSGKTIISAFAVKSFKAKKLLFIAHRENIIQKSKETYLKIFSDKKMGILIGNKKEKNKDYIFTTIQTISKKHNYQKFNPENFDYIIIDEVHHSGAKTYQEIIDYFNPKFLLGLTATPKRGDGYNIYNLFNNNIIYELSLKSALNQKLLTPFFYYGISDIKLEKQIQNNEEIEFLNLNNKDRIKYIVEKSKLYGYSGERLCSLIFVSNIKEGINLEINLNKYGYKAKLLTGKDKESKRAKIISDFENGIYNYLITIDIFNEGIDIPCVNQIILLRKTESTTIYIQQLGRGLRKYPGQKFIVVLDFIANYTNNFLLPMALMRKNNYDKQEILNFMSQDKNIVYGDSIVEFDKIAQKQIFEQISKVKFNSIKLLEMEYQKLREKLDKRIMLADFYKEEKLSPNIILQHTRIMGEKVSGSKEILDTLEQQYLQKKKYNTFFEIKRYSEGTENNIKYISNFLTPAKRLEEILIIQILIVKKQLSRDKLKIEIKKYYEENKIKFTQDSLEINLDNALLHLERNIFQTYSNLKEYSKLISKIKGEYYLINNLDNVYVWDLLTYNLAYWKNNYLLSATKNLIEYQLYTKVETFHYLNLNYNNSYQVSGYTLFDYEKIGMLYINFDSFSYFNSYENQIKKGQFITFYSKKGRKIRKKNKVGEYLTKEGKLGENYYSLHLFGRKNTSKEYYYLGKIMEVINYNEENNKIKYTLKLEKELPYHMINYFKKNL